MREVIDELSLKIDVNAKRGIAKTITAIADAITTLNKSVRNVGALERYVGTLNKLMKPMTRAPKSMAIGKVIKPEMEEVTDQSKKGGLIPSIGSKAQETAQSNKEIKDSIAELNMTYAQWAERAELVSKSLKTNAKGAQQLVEKFKLVNAEGKIFTATAIDKTLKNVSDTGKVAKKEIEELNDEVKNADKPTKKYTSFFKKLVKSIGRIAFYRAIRMAINQVAKAFEEEFKNFVKFDDEANASMSNITNSVNQLKNSLGITLGSALTALEPIITSLAESAKEFINSLNMALAKMQGKSTYKKAIKQNEDYAKSLDKASSSLLSFDKFETLTDKKDKSPFEEVAVDGEDNALANTFVEIADTLKNLWKVVKPILEKIWDLVSEIVGIVGDVITPILEIVTTLLDVFMPVIDLVIDNIGSIIDIVRGVVQQIVGAVQMISGILKLLTGDFEGAWEMIANGFANMVNGIVNMFIGLVNSLIDGINHVIAPITKIASWFGKDWKIDHIEWKADWQPYANGGMVPKGTKFIAGESGAEIVHQSSAGTGVANIEQIRQAQYLATMDAIQDSGILNALSNIGGDVIIDGRKCGQVITKHVVDEGTRVGYFKKA